MIESPLPKKGLGGKAGGGTQPEATTGVDMRRTMTFFLGLALAAAPAALGSVPANVASAVSAPEPWHFQPKRMPARRGSRRFRLDVAHTFIKQSAGSLPLAGRGRGGTGWGCAVPSEPPPPPTPPRKGEEGPAQSRGRGRRALEDAGGRPPGWMTAPLPVPSKNQARSTFLVSVLGDSPVSAAFT